MERTNLTPPTPLACVAVAGAGVTGLTVIGIAAGALVPDLAGSMRPHPALTGSIADWAGIAVNNGRVLAAPFLLVALGCANTRARRRIGDVLLIALVGANTVPVGVALGRWGAQLIPYIPQLPLEWGALAVALGAWLHLRQRPHLRRLASFAGTALLLVTAAAAVETWCTPHRMRTVSATAMAGSQEIQAGSSSGWGSVVVSAAEFALPTVVRFKVAGFLSLTAFGSAAPLGGAVPCSQQPPTPTGGITC